MATATPSEQTQAAAAASDRTLVLHGNQASCVVEAGQAFVFCARVQDGTPVGPRRYLWNCEAGDLLPGLVNGQTTSEYRFLAVGNAEIRFRPVSLEQALTATGNDRPQLGKWIEQLTTWLAVGAPPPVAANVSTTAETQLSAGQTFRWGLPDTCWIRVVEGSIDFLGLPYLRLQVGDALPVGSAGWFQTLDGARLEVVPADGIGELKDVQHGLETLHRLFFEFLLHKERADDEREAARLQQRQQQETIDTARAVASLVSVVQPQPEAEATDAGLMAALAHMGKHLQIRFQEPAKSEDMRRVNDPLEAVARASRLRMRQVLLRGEWWQSDCGPLLGYLMEGEQQHPVALVRDWRGRYQVFDPRTGVLELLTAQTRAALSPRAVMFYRPFPDRPLTLWDLPRFAMRLYVREIALVLAVSLFLTLLGMLVPQATRWLIDEAIPDASHSRVYELALALVAVNCGQAAFLIAQGIITLRMQTGSTAALQCATWDRLLRLAPGFFRRFASGDLLNRSMMITEVSHSLSGTMMRSLLTGVMAGLNLFLLLNYSFMLALVAMGVGLVCATVTFVLAELIRRKAAAIEVQEGQLFGFMVQAINGVAKLRVAAAERRAYNYWARRFAEKLRLFMSVRTVQDYGALWNMAVPTLSTILIFYLATNMLLAAPGAGKQALSMGTFMAFYFAFGTFVAGLTSVGQVGVEFSNTLARQKLMKPILEAELEYGADRADPGRLTGGIELDKIVFRYQDKGPLILNGVSLVAQPGEFVALVGPSGSGKSTIFRLLMGFEKPESGAVLFDGKNLHGLDLTAVRRQLGVVLQSARINAGSVFDNISCGSIITLEEAWTAARDAGFEDDLEQMPMGMHTVISEGGTNLSGGQRQRMLIARALALNPRILLFDEATSALDNTTQMIVTRSLQRRYVTRIVVAHRLSTVERANKIYVLEKGKVIQVGTYEDLAKQEGLFQRMIARQTT